MCSSDLQHLEVASGEQAERVVVLADQHLEVASGEQAERVVVLADQHLEVASGEQAEHSSGANPRACFDNS